MLCYRNPTKLAQMFKHTAVSELQKLMQDDFLYDESEIAQYIGKTNGPSVKGVIMASTAEQLSQIIDIANRYKQALYPLSTGKNWGLGGKRPCQAEAIILDLSKMNKIREVNLRYGYAVIEPGVTQGQLYEHLTAIDAPYLINTTGSGWASSLLGNSLERGDGYYDLRADDILGMEVLLGNGKRFKTGFGHYANQQTEYLYPHGLGPDLRGLFFQSNFGVILNAGFRLMPRKPVHGIVVCKLNKESKLSDFLDSIFDLKKEGVWNTEIHIADIMRSKTTALPLLFDFYLQEGLDKNEARIAAEDTFNAEVKNSWSALGAMAGTKKELSAKMHTIRKRMAGYGKVMLFTKEKWQSLHRVSKGLGFLASMKRKEAMLYSVEPLIGVIEGRPTNAALKSIHWNVSYPVASFEELEKSNAGLKFVLPLFPFDGRRIPPMIEATRRIFDQFGFSCAITLNTFTEQSLGGVINIGFDRRVHGKAQKAIEAVRAVCIYYQSEGIICYRHGIDTMDIGLSSDDSFWQSVAELKKVLDPNAIISPGRYNLVLREQST